MINYGFFAYISAFCVSRQTVISLGPKVKA